MQLRRNEIMTGLLVLSTVAVLAFILIMLGAPGLFRPLVIYKLYFDNAAGINLGAPVLLAGRKVGQVKSLNSPVSREEAAAAVEAAANLGTVTGPGSAAAGSLPRFEVRIDVEVDRTALVYKNANVRLMTDDVVPAIDSPRPVPTAEGETPHHDRAPLRGVRLRTQHGAGIGA